MTEPDNFNAGNTANGRMYEEEQVQWLQECGLTIVARRYTHECGVEFDIVALDLDGCWVAVECKSSQDTASQPGMTRSDTRQKIAGNLHELTRWWKQHGKDFRYVLITSHLPAHDDVERRTNAQRERLDRYELDGHLTVIHRPWRPGSA